jgi:hypothetical protein
MKAAGAKLLVIGFDALDYELFKAHTRLRSDLYPLYSPVPVTGPAWTSIYTGDSVAKHGVREGWGFSSVRRYARSEFGHRAHWFARWLAGRCGLRRREPVLRTYRTTESVYMWDSLGKAGVTVKLVNLPITSPARAVRGVHVAGFPLDLRRRWYWPDSVSALLPQDYAELSDVIQWFEDPVLDRYHVWRGPLHAMGLAAAKEKVRRTAHRLADLFVALPRGDLEMVQFSFIDRLGHAFGIAGETEEFCYALADELVRAVLRGSCPDSMLIVSDHGFQGSEHTSYGCLAINGALAGRVRVPEDYEPSVLDVAPTIAGCFGASHHPCEGNDLTSRRAIAARGAADADGDRAEIMARMRDVGYS